VIGEIQLEEICARAQVKADVEDILPSHLTEALQYRPKLMMG
jgi:hypothetical protein